MTFTYNSNRCDIMDSITNTTNLNVRVDSNLKPALEKIDYMIKHPEKNKSYKICYN